MAVLFDSNSALLSILGNARISSAFSSKGPVAKMRSFQAGRIARGRPGFPRPLPPARIGLSSSSRQQINSFLSQSSAGNNTLFSIGLNQTSTVESAKIQILALRARFSPDALAPSLRGTTVDRTA